MCGKSSVTVEQFGLGDPRIHEFVRLAWKLNRGDPCWTPPLNADLVGSRLLGTKGLLTPAHPYHQHADVTHFLARRDGSPVGRVSAAINHRFNDYYGVRLGFFGFFETVDDIEVASALVGAAREWVSSRGMERMRGPGEYSNVTHERQAVLIDGFEHPPTVELTHNPPYYGSLLERCGLSKVMDYHAHLIDLQAPPSPRLTRLAEAVRARDSVRVRPVDMRVFTDEVRAIVRIYNEAWSEDWGYLPITDEEADALADTLKPIVDPGLIRFAEVDGEPVAVLGAFPDPYWALQPRWRWYGDSDPVRLARLLRHRRHIPRVRLMFFGIRPGRRRAGIDALLFDETHRYARAHGYKTCEASMLLEDNDLVIRAAEFMGGKRYKTWRIYEMPVAR